LTTKIGDIDLRQQLAEGVGQNWPEMRLNAEPGPTVASLYSPLGFPFSFC